MDFLDPKKKRAYRIRLLLGYFLMAVALSIGALILLFQATGYDLNRKTGQVIQNGLVFVDSYPESARIIINGKDKASTGARFVLPTGPYNIKLERSGYRTWQRTLELEGSVVERLTYPFIFPQKLEPQDAKQFASPPGFATQSPDRRWLIVQQLGELSVFDAIDLGDKANPSLPVSLPAGLVNTAAGSHKWEMVEWSTDNRHVLLKHTFTGGSEFVMVDRENPAESYNVNKIFGTNPEQVALRDKKFDRLYLLDAAANLFSADVGSQQTAQLATGIKAFKGYGADVVLYVTETGAGTGKVLVQVRRDNDVYKLREMQRGERYVVDLAKYSDDWFMAAGSSAEKRVLIYKNSFDDMAREVPRLPAPLSVLRVDNLQYLSFSANARFIGAQGGSEFSIYDTEHDRQYRYDTKLKLPEGYRAIWMDGYRYMLVTAEGKVVVFDYDGINLQTLSASDPSLAPYFDRSYDFLYTLGPSAGQAGKTGLLKTPMRITTDQ